VTPSPLGYAHESVDRRSGARLRGGSSGLNHWMQLGSVVGSSVTIGLEAVAVEPEAVVSRALHLQAEKAWTRDTTRSAAGAVRTLFIAHDRCV